MRCDEPLLHHPPRGISTRVGYTGGQNDNPTAAAAGFWGVQVVTQDKQGRPVLGGEAGDQNYLQRYTNGNNQFSPYRTAR